MRFSLPELLGQEVQASLRRSEQDALVRRIWERDASVWTNTDESRWLGWLDVTRRQLADGEHLRRIAADAASSGFSDALLFGMGGSSLCPEVLAMTFGNPPGFPRLRILDSTDPAEVAAAEQGVDMARSLFLTASKSGSTLETSLFQQYFLERSGGAKDRFIAITDPGSHLDREAVSFRDRFHGEPEIGGRFSALSNFGMVPAAVMGIDTGRFLASADRMVAACAASTPADENPGLLLGVILGVAANRGHDKLTLVIPTKLPGFGAWIEQLIAESTGKEGKGIIPVDGEPLAGPESYAKDRLFVQLRVPSSPEKAADAAIDALEKAGHPVVRLPVADIYDLGQEFYRWEFATAVAGSVMGVNPFNQPDVEFSKKATRAITDTYEEKGALPAEDSIFESDDVRLFADTANAEALAPRERSLAGYLRAHLDRIGQGDYFALLAYVHRTEAHDGPLQRLRGMVRAEKRVATCVGYGPRFLHSTGQAYKAGPPSGVFLQITCENAADLAVPGRKSTFGLVKAAQAAGDLQVLFERGRRALRVHLKGDPATGLNALEAAATEALR